MGYLQSFLKNNKYAVAINLFKGSFGAYKYHIILIIFLGFISSFLEGIGISAVIPAFSFVNGQAGVANDAITTFIRHFFDLVHLTYTFQILVILIGLLFVARICVLFVIQYITARIVFGYERNMRNELFSLTTHSNWSYLSKQKVGHLDQLLITNTTNSSQFFAFISTLTLVITKTIVYVIVAINISATVAFVSLLIGALTFFVFKPLFQKNKIISGHVEALNRKLAHFVSQNMVGMKTIKSFFVESYVDKSAHEYFEGMRRYNVNTTVLRGITEMLLKFTGLGVVGIIFIYLYKTPGFNFASFTVIVYVINQIFTQIQAAQTQLHAISMMVPYLQTSVSHLEEARKNAETYGGSQNPEMSAPIVFDKVGFSYPDRGAILSDITFEIKSGQTVGIVGPSGSGKTTVVDLILRLYGPHTGSILLGNKNVEQFSLGDWRKNIGYVTQDAFLVNDTIEKNILFYNQASKKDVEEAAKTANIHDFILSLPQGYQTVVGDRGVLLSGGQRQRIALARAVLRKPKLLVLDEATSALDSESEQAVQKAIEALHHKVTVLIIAHRLSTISNVDQLIVLNKGKIAEMGKPEDLINNKDSYFHKMQ